MPSLINYSRLESKLILDLLNVDYKFEGYGYVYEQSIEKGKKIDRNTKVVLKLKSHGLEESDEDEKE